MASPKDINRSGTLILRTPDASEDRKGTLKSFVPPSIPPVHVEVDLDAVAANAREVQASVGPCCGVLAMLKADAYGHGLSPVAMTLQQDRTVAGIVVSSIRDGLTLRKDGITLPIIALVCRYGNRHGVVLDAGIIPMLGGQADLEAFSRAARARGRRVDVHVELDTGMSRSGVREEDISLFLSALAQRPEIVVSGLCTQLCAADEERPVSAHRQLDAFERGCSRFRAAGHVPTMIHAANTAATSRLPRSHFSHVRVGIALFGGDEPSGTELRPAMRVTTRIVQLRSIGPGESVGYGAKWKAERRSQIATLPVGYAHGYPRRLLGRADVIVRGRRCPLVGSICMETTMVDVTDVDGVAIDDEVVLVGESGVTEIRVAELARAMDGIVEEFLCAVPKAAMRTYTRHSS
jgi:alanine racemase